MASHALKRSIVRLLRNRPVGVPAAMACLSLGARELSRKISRECGFVPAIVDIALPPSLAVGAHFRMDSDWSRDQVSRGIWLYGWDSFEKPMPELFGACSREARRVFDVGAYSGFYSLLAATCNPTVEVLAFEPFPRIRETLTRNLALNGLSDRVRVIAAAASDQNGRADFFTPPNLNGWIETASSLDSQFCGEHESVITVDVVTLDSIRFEDRCGPVDLIKIDAEQAEHRVLDGLRRLLTEDRPFVFLEVLPGNPFCPQIEAIREDAGYVSGAIHRQGVDWRDGVEGVDTGNPFGSNQVLCPSEKQEWFDAIVRSLGYRLTRMELSGPRPVA